MARPKKEITKVKKLKAKVKAVKKLRTKKIKDSFLEIGKLYSFIYYGNPMGGIDAELIARIIDATTTELRLVKDDEEIILSRRIIVSVSPITE